MRIVGSWNGGTEGTVGQLGRWVVGAWDSAAFGKVGQLARWGSWNGVAVGTFSGTVRMVWRLESVGGGGD